MWNHENDDARHGLERSGSGSGSGPGNQGGLWPSDPEVADRLWRHGLTLAILLAVIIGGSCLAVLVMGFSTAPSRYGTGARTVAAIGVPVTIAAGVLAVRARRGRQPWGLLGAVAVTLAYAVALMMGVRA